MPAGDTPQRITELVLPSCAPVSEIADGLFAKKNIYVQLLRLDQIDPELGGNKAFKLIPNIIRARASGHNTLLSFGGAYSNHLHALAEAGHRFNFKTIGVVRGDDGQEDSHTLKFAVSKGMQLIRVSRQDYRRRNEAEFIAELAARLGQFYLIPEGGANDAGRNGSAQLASVILNSLLSDMPDEILLPCGTGTTMAGLIAGLLALPISNRPFVRGVAVLKQGEFLRSGIADYLQTLTDSNPTDCNWVLDTQYHWGGYARFPAQLAVFVREFERTHKIMLDPVYTAKMMSAFYQRVTEGMYKPGSRILLVHTGGLQGRIPGRM